MLELTYPQFHAVFVLPALGVLTAATLVHRHTDESVVRPLPVAVVTVVALAYTIPWDNYLIHRGVWWYGNGRVATVLWNAPLSEYVFILLVPFVGALWLHHLSVLLPTAAADVTVTRRDRAAGVAAAALIGVAGAGLFTQSATLYLGAILAWSAPVFGLQWAVGWPHLWARRQLVALGIAGPTLYLSAVDRIAIADGVWELSTSMTTGVTVAGLPVEEGLFFLVTSAFIVQALVLYPWVLDRWQ
jgi:lycopene cyclase domain-containing protein